MSVLTDTYKDRVDDMLIHSFDELEEKHDFIQWVFPTKTVSQYNDDAPVLTDEDIEYFKEHLIPTVRVAFNRMLAFYGLVTKNGYIVFDNTAVGSYNWFQTKPYRDHNMLRITRILECLNLLGLRDEAEMFYDCLSIIAPHCDSQTRNSHKYWSEVMDRFN